MLQSSNSDNLWVHRDELEQSLNNFLEVPLFRDYAPNGLQIEGTERIQHICTAVSASLEVVEKSIKNSADAILVHHGYFWKNEPLVLKGIKKSRIALILQHNINLFAYHLPLDSNLQLGNNACVAEKIGIINIQTLPINGIPNLLWVGDLQRTYTFNEFSMYLQSLFPRFHAAVSADVYKPIRRVAWCTGAAQDYIHYASDLKVDAFLSGEISERTYDEARELNVHYFACGHYLTESMAIQKLGGWISEKYGCTHQFISTDNPY